MRRAARTLDARQIAPRVAAARAVTLAGLTLLLGAITARMLSSGTPPLMLVPALLPLLIFVPGTWRGNPRSVALLCFVCLLYFCVLTVRLFAPDRTLFDLIAMVAVVTLFVAAMLFTRWRKQQLHVATESGAPAHE